MKKYFYIFLLMPLIAFAEENIELEVSETETSVLETENTIETKSENTQLSNISLFAVPEPPAEPPKPTPPDPITSLKGVQGKFDVSLFSGTASYSYPIKIPNGRGNMTPFVNLGYTSNNRSYESILGLSWNLNENAIYRSTEKGIDQLYNQNDFTASINGSADELVIVDESAEIYGAKNEQSFTKYFWQTDHFIAYDTEGNKYTFGDTSTTKQTDSNDTTRVYKWLLSKKEDLNGNFITYTYFHDNGQVYPDKIRYTGNGAEEGIYEIRFERESRPSYVSYTRGFKTETKYRIDKIETYVYEGGTPQKILTYDLDYTDVNNAVQLLTGITQKTETESLPSTMFEYYDGSEDLEYKKMHYLKKIISPSGGIQTLKYKPASAYRDTNGEGLNRLSFPVHTLHESIIQTSALSPSYSTFYDYEGGHYYYDNLDAYKKEYAGFHTVTITDPIGNVKKLYFHQSENSPDNSASSLQGEFADHIAKKGRIYREEQFDDAENLFTVSLNKWDKQALVSAHPTKERYFIFSAQTVQSQYDGGTTPRTQATQSVYDDWGNVVTETDFGEVTLSNQSGNFIDIKSDKIITTTVYAQNASKNLYRLPKKNLVHDFNNNQIGESVYYYDELAFGEVNKGNLTQTENLVSVGNVKTQKYEYNAFGLVTKFIDARNKATDVIYESDNLFPQSVTNAKNHQTQFVYDKRFGMQTQTTDPNGAKTKTELDDFGRVVAEKISNPLDLNSLETVKIYEYDLVNKPISVTQKVYPQSGIEVVQKTYMDGLDRVIQVRSEAEIANNFVITNTTYDELGNVKKSFLPFESSGLAFETINTNVVGTSFDYDALNRQIQITTPLGETNLTYLLDKKQVVDSENNQKDYFSDVRGNLVVVKEYLDSQDYSTFYTYNSLNQLTKMTDAKGNVKNFTYDLLGQKLSEESWHTLNDTTFGSTNFSYDENGNLTQKINARNQTTNYSYDELNRLLVENNVEINGLEVENVYDQNVNGIGRLTSVTTPNVIKQFTYDALGRVLQNKKIIDAQPFDLDFTYNWLGLPLMVQYPDDTQVAYTYNEAGQLESIATSTDSVVTNLDYAPSGSLEQIDFANGVQTVNTFLPSQMYRLTHKVSTFEGNKLQDLAYTYDSVGNLSQIVDASGTNTAKTTDYLYDDLYRLTQSQVNNSANNQDYTRTYSYDIIGNILNKSDKGTYVYAGGNDATSSATNATPHAVTSDGTKTYAYDDDGNLSADGTWTHVWDYNNRLLNSTDGTTTMNYTYDEGVNRLKKTNVGSAKTTYYVDKYYDLEDGKGKSHIYAGDLKVGTKVSEASP